MPVSLWRKGQIEIIKVYALVEEFILFCDYFAGLRHKMWQYSALLQPPPTAIPCQHSWNSNGPAVNGMKLLTIGAPQCHTLLLWTLGCGGCGGRVSVCSVGRNCWHFSVMALSLLLLFSTVGYCACVRLCVCVSPGATQNLTWLTNTFCDCGILELYPPCSQVLDILLV